MLGTIPSTYLKWVSKNLRARDFEHWAKLADQVLKDPVYKDRLLLELSERFGQVNFELLGTSKGGRIPRILDDESEKDEEKELFKVKKKERVGMLTESEERRRKRRSRMRAKEKTEIRNGDKIDGESERDDDKDLRVEINNPFPGREALLKKVLNRKKFM
ncbi:hypothetical protein Patl1_34964 [Pistacia atlantica]|uniref:Uncharacterized protein n=1 Tax=Pistacia atlantica TaxID=434234 RepID=A0ACC0ZT92_9ROSI|nr:hypothetical protein Patl1_34964 [Pistacia atlantica]